jgi:hypothetical protein
MGWIEGKCVRLLLPAFANEFVGGESAKSLETFGEVVGTLLFQWLIPSIRTEASSVVVDMAGSG